MTPLYVRVELKDGALVNFVGVHPLKWRKCPEQPDAGFRPVAFDELERLAALIKECPDEPVENLVEQVWG